MAESRSINLSETLFKKHKQAQETSELINYMPSSQEWLTTKLAENQSAWYRDLKRYQWIWQGINPLDLEATLSKVASSDHSRTHDHWLDTVMGYHSGNWTYEWIKLGSHYQRLANEQERDFAAELLFSASLCFSIASYPHLKYDHLSLQAQTLTYQTYLAAAKQSRYEIKQIDIPFENKKIVTHLHLPDTNKSYPVVIVCAGLDNLQTDMWRLFRDYLAPNGIAMLTVDMPSVGHSSHWMLTEDSSLLHQTVLNELPNIPWVDHFKVGLFGFRFGGNAMVRLSFLESKKIKACVTLGGIIHDGLVSPVKCLNRSKMYLDVMSSRLGKQVVDVHSLSKQIMAWSLKKQGFLSSYRTKVPILALGLEDDPISPHSDNQMVALFSEYGKAKKLKTKTLTSGYEQALELSIEWFKEELYR